MHLDSRAHLPRALRLLRKVVATRWFDSTHVAAALGVPTCDLNSFVVGEAELSFHRQLRLADFVIANVPPLARAAHRLRIEVSAAMASAARDHGTPVHAA